MSGREARRREEQKPLFYAPRESSLWFHGGWGILRLFVHLCGTARFELPPEDAARLRALYRHAAILSPNHPTAAEGPLLYLVGHRLKLRYIHCAALEIYDKFGPLGPHLFPGLGCFSIRRRMIDFPAVRTARAMLAARRNIVLFPEGEISGLSDALLPLERGGVQIAFWGLEERDGGGTAAAEDMLPPLYLVPIAIKYRETGDAGQAIRDSMGRLEGALGLIPAPGRGGLWRLHRIEAAYLTTLEADLGLSTGQGRGNDRWERVRRAMEARAAAGLEIMPPSPDLLTCPQRAREMLNAWDAAWFRHGPKGPKKDSGEWTRLKALHQDVARLNRFMGFDDSYVSAWPSVDRFGDVLRRLEGQVLGRHGFKNRRIARLRVGEPIDLAACYPDYRRDKKATVARVCGELESRISGLLGELVRELSRPWEEAHDAAAENSGVSASPAASPVSDRQTAV